MAPDSPAPTPPATAPAAAPDAPAPLVPLPASAPNHPALSATEQATKAARAALAAGHSLSDLGPAAKPATPRTESGQFAKKDAEGSTPRPSPLDAPTPAAADAPPAPANAETPPAAPLDGDPGDEQQGEVPAAPAAEEIDNPDLVVGLPPRRDGEPALEIAAPDRETAEALRRLVNGYARREAIEQQQAQLADQAERYTQIQEQIQIDPVGYLTGAVPAEVQADVALSLLTQPDIWERVRDTVLSFDDESTFNLTAAEARARRLELRDQLRTAVQQRHVVQENAAQVKQAVASLVPQTMSDEQAEAFYRDALRDLREHAERNGLRTLNVEDVPLLLARRMRMSGIDPMAAASRLAAPQDPTTTGTPARTPPTRQGAPASGSAPSQRTGAQFRQASVARKAAAVTPAGGAGAPAATPLAPPPGQSIAERIEWSRKHLKLAPR